MADPTALSEGLRKGQARPKITDEEESTLCPPDRATGASQTVSEVQTPNETPLGSRCEDPHGLQAATGMPTGFAMLKVSMIVSQKLQDRGVSFLPEGKPSTSKEDRPLAKVGTAPWLTHSFRRQRPIPPAPGSQEKQEVTHRIILDQLKEEQEAASRSSSALIKEEQAPPVQGRKPAQEGEEEQMAKAAAPKAAAALDDELRAKACTALTRGGREGALVQVLHARSQRKMEEQCKKHRTTNDQLKEISDRNEINTWLHESNNSKGDETMDLLQCSMQKASSSVGGFLYRHELLGLFPCLDGNTWDAETTEELLAKSGLQFCNDGKIEVATFFHWLVQAASSERIRLVG